MNEWLVLVIVFLWITGGVGWTDAYEAREDTEFTVVGKGIVLALWPAMAVVAGVTHMAGDLRQAWSGSGRDED